MCVSSNLVSSLLESHRRVNETGCPGGLSRTTDNAASAAPYREPGWLSLQT